MKKGNKNNFSKSINEKSWQECLKEQIEKEIKNTEELKNEYLKDKEFDENFANDITQEMLNNINISMPQDNGEYVSVGTFIAEDNEIEDLCNDDVLERTIHEIQRIFIKEENNDKKEEDNENNISENNMVEIDVPDFETFLKEDLDKLDELDGIYSEEMENEEELKEVEKEYMKNKLPWPECLNIEIERLEKENGESMKNNNLNENYKNQEKYLDSINLMEELEEKSNINVKEHEQNLERINKKKDKKTKNKTKSKLDKIDKMFEKKELSKTEIKCLKKMGLKPKVSILDNLNEKDMYIFNELKMIEYIKENNMEEYDGFKFTEPGSERTKVKNFKNLKEWDYKEWEFQKDYNPDLGTEYKELYMRGNWFRVYAKRLQFIQKKELIYGQLESAEEYITTEVTEKLSERLDKLIPNERYTPYDQEMFKKEKDSKYYTMAESVIRAGGREEEYEKLYKEINSIETYNFIKETTKNELINFNNCTFRRLADKKEDMDFFLIGGVSAAKNVTFKNFMFSFMELSQPFGIIENIIEKIYFHFENKILGNTKIL